MSEQRARLLAGLLLLPAIAAAAELKPEAARGFDQYVQRTEQRIRNEVARQQTFLRTDTLPAAQHAHAQQQLQRGEVIVERSQEWAGATIPTPGALIHHWTGTILVRGATLSQVLRAAQDYDRHQEYFQPEVVRSRTLRHVGDDFRIYLRLKRTKVLTVVFDTEHEVRYRRLDAQHVYSESRSTRIAEVEHPGETGERELPSSEEHGFLWRLNSYWRFAETSDGVYVQCEAVSLTRDIPTGLGWLVGPFVQSIPRESLQSTLEALRRAVARAS